MTIESFVKHYNLHDSYITSVEYSVDSHCVLLFIDFAFWMQESYKDGEPENGIIQVEFQDQLFRRISRKSSKYKDLRQNGIPCRGK